MSFDLDLHARFKDLRSNLSQFIVGQDNAKDWIAMVAAEHIAGVQIAEGEPRVVLLVGATGSGKTELCRTLARIMRASFIRVDATELTQTAFKGRQIESVIEELAQLDEALNKQLGSIESDEPYSRSRGVVLIDEFDKLAFHPDIREQTQERHLFAVQAALLRLFEGKKIKIADDTKDYDSSSLLVLAAGAFQNSDIAKYVREREGTNVDPLEGHWPFIMHEDLIRFGLLPELVGRIRAIVPLQKLSLEDMREIMRRRILHQDQEILGCRLVIDAQAADLIAERAIERNLGGRAVGIIFSEIRLHIFKQVPGIEIDEKNARITLTLDYATRNWSPSL